MSHRYLNNMLKIHVHWVQLKRCPTLVMHVFANRIVIGGWSSYGPEVHYADLMNVFRRRCMAAQQDQEQIFVL